MCRIRALAATALSLGMVLGAASPALAWFSKPATPVKAPAVQTQAQGTLATGTRPELRRASAQERALVARLDPLARAAFWGREAQTDSNDIEAGLGLSQALRALGKNDDAVEAAQRVLVTHPTNVEAMLEVARGHIGRGQGFYAIDPARQAQALAPRDWRAPSLLGVAYEQAGRDEEAMTSHRLALTLAPNNPAALSNLAMFLAGRGQAVQAESLLREACAKPGAGIAIRQNLALVLGLQGRLDEAEKLVREDLPPEQVASNMAYLRAAAAPNGPGRTWDAMRANP